MDIPSDLPDVIEPACVVQDNQIKSVNDAFAQLLGYPQNELAGRPWDVVAPLGHRLLEEACRQTRDMRRERCLHTRAVHRSGTLIDIELYPQPTTWEGLPALHVAVKRACFWGTLPAAGNLDPSVWPVLENTSQELLKAQEETERLSLHKEELLAAMNEMVFLISKHRVIEYMNRKAIATFGKMTGRLCYEVLCRGEELCAEGCAVLGVTASDSPQLIEARMGGLEVEYSAVAFAGYRGDELALVVMRDISERKRLEKEVESFNRNLEEVIRKKIEQLKESERMREKLAEEASALRSKLHLEQDVGGMIGNNKSIRELRELVHNVADSGATVLVTGESGTGKELVANLIHRQSPRRDRIFLKFNCAAVSESLLESDLFGYEKGAFTGAAATRKGKFEFADGGTIFLDEIGDISPRMQVALLRVLQNGEMQRVGASETIKVDVRVIAATNRDLALRVSTGEFREDLYYRLNILAVQIPPLRERKDDIVALATHFVRKYRQDFNKDIDFLPADVIEKLLSYDWPGNVRELENVIQRALILARGNVLTVTDMVFSPPPSLARGRPAPSPEPDQLVGQPLRISIAELEKKIIAAALARCRGKVQDAAKMLGLGKTVLYTKIKRFGLQ